MAGIGRARLDLVGRQFGRLTVKAFHSLDKGRNTRWLCVCNCGIEGQAGNETIVLGTVLMRTGKKATRSCGCLSRDVNHRLQLVGKRFGVLTVLKCINAQDGRTRWKCRCDCGAEVNCMGSSLVSGMTRGHWCELTHGLRGDLAGRNKKLTDYRCAANNRNLPWTLPDEVAFSLFKENCYYCGSAPSNISKSWKNRRKEFVYNGIDRVDNTKGYEPDNVVSCCKNCNRAKREMSYEDFITWLDQLALYRHQNKHVDEVAA